MTAPSEIEVILSVSEGKVPTIRDVEKTLIDMVLRFTQGNKTKAAKYLGICQRTLRYKMNEYNLDQWRGQFYVREDESQRRY